jgi:hypothetical protein
LRSSNATTYQWFLDGSQIAGASAQTYTITKNGVYKVRISDNTGCSAFSDEVNAVFVGLEDDINASVTVYPNPFKDEMILTLNDDLLAKGCSYSVLNDLGQTVLTTQHAGKTNKIDLSGRSSGLYLIRLSVNGETVVKRILKY